jgi:hypothetical protein
MGSPESIIPDQFLHDFQFLIDTILQKSAEEAKKSGKTPEIGPGQRDNCITVILISLMASAEEQQPFIESLKLYRFSVSCQQPFFQQDEENLEGQHKELCLYQEILQELLTAVIPQQKMQALRDRCNFLKDEALLFSLISIANISLQSFDVPDDTIILLDRILSAQVEILKIQSSPHIQGSGSNEKCLGETASSDVPSDGDTTASIVYSP